MKSVLHALVAIILLMTSLPVFAGGGGGGGDRPIKISISLDWLDFPFLWRPRSSADRLAFEAAENARRDFCAKNPDSCSQEEKDWINNPDKSGHCGDVYGTYYEAAGRCPMGADLIPNFRSRSQWTCHCYGRVVFPK